MGGLGDWLHIVLVACLLRTGGNRLTTSLNLSSLSNDPTRTSVHCLSHFCSRTSVYALPFTHFRLSTWVTHSVSRSVNYSVTTRVPVRAYTGWAGDTRRLSTWRQQPHKIDRFRKEAVGSSYRGTERMEIEFTRTERKGPIVATAQISRTQGIPSDWKLGPSFAICETRRSGSPQPR